MRSEAFARSLALTLTLIGFTACASQALEKAPPGQPIAVGWVQAAGEVRIYSKKANLGKLYDGTCISGVMSRGRSMPRRYNGRFVAAYGSIIGQADLGDMAANSVSIGVENYCNSSTILIIERLVELRAPQD